MKKIVILLATFMMSLTSCYRRTDGVIGDFVNAVSAIVAFVVIVGLIVVVVKGWFDDKDKTKRK